VNDVPMATRDLIVQARAGDAQALQVLLQRYREYVRLLVRCRASGRLQARFDSSDLVQETLLGRVLGMNHKPTSNNRAQ
jgi:DNA-directed RNA polymerase specialized sigma24 family protein